MSEELKRLMIKVNNAKGASMFNAKEAVHSALDDLMRYLMQQEQRIQRLERLAGPK